MVCGVVYCGVVWNRVREEYIVFVELFPIVQGEVFFTGQSNGLSEMAPC